MTGLERLHSTSLRLRSWLFTDGRTRSASLIALGAFVIHQLRLLAVGPGAADRSWDVSTILGHLAPLVVALLLAGASARLVRSRFGGGDLATDRRLRAGSYALGIVAVFACQQLMEGVLLAGHAGGIASIFSSGGWAALPLAIIFGVIAALVDRGIEEVEAWLAEGEDPGSPPALVDDRHGADFLPRRLSPLASGLAVRPPPVFARS